MQLVQTLTADSGSVAEFTFSNIPQDATDLLVLFSLRATGNVAESRTNWTITAGSPTTYSYRRLRGDGSAADSLTGSEAYPVLLPGNTGTANTFGNGSFYIANYRSSVAKTGSIDHVGEGNFQSAPQILMATSFAGTSPITAIAVSAQNGNWAQNSSVSLYKITRA
jgi:hypothetical protein